MAQIDGLRLTGNYAFKLENKEFTIMKMHKKKAYLERFLYYLRNGMTHSGVKQIPGYQVQMMEATAIAMNDSLRAIRKKNG